MKLLGVWCFHEKGMLAIGRLFLHHLDRDYQWWWKPWTAEGESDRTLFWGRFAVTWHSR